MPCVVPTINLFSIQEIEHPKWGVALGFRQGLFEGFFRTACGSLRSRRQPPHPLASTNPPDLHSSNRLQRPAMRTHPHPEPLRAEALGDLATGIDAGDPHSGATATKNFASKRAFLLAVQLTGRPMPMRRWGLNPVVKCHPGRGMSDQRRGAYIFTASIVVLIVAFLVNWWLAA